MRGAGSTERPGVPGEERAALVPFHRPQRGHLSVKEMNPAWEVAAKG